MAHDDLAAPLKRQRTSSSNSANANDGCAHFALASATYAQQLRQKTAAAAHKQQQLEIERLARNQQDPQLSSSVHSEIYECLSCPFSGVREYTNRSASPSNGGNSDRDDCSFMAHAILHAHPLGLLVRKQQLYCASCRDFVYPDALRLLHGSSRAQASTAAAQQQQHVSTHRGLINMGNTCYMNVVFQALAHNPLLQHYFLIAKRHGSVLCKQQQSLTAEGSAPAAKCLGCDLGAFLAALTPSLASAQARPSPSAASSPFVPHRLMETLWHVAPSFVGAKQHDAHEFFLALLNGVHAHTHTPRRASASDASPTSPRFTPTGTPQCDCAVHQHFAGALVSQVECAVCSEVSCTYDPFLDLSLSLDSAPSGKRPGATAAHEPLSLDALLQAFTAEESLRGINRVYCRRCRTYANMTKRLRLHARPNVLVVHIKRLDFHKQQKRGAYVAFPLTDLRLDAYVAADDSNGDDDGRASKQPRGDCPSLAKLVARTGARGDDADRYDLAAVVTHHGDSVQGGHYTAFIQSSLELHHTQRSRRAQAPPQWLLFDDASVTHVSAHEVQQSQAYMLFYVKRRPTLLLS